MRNKLGRFGMLVNLILLICGVAVLLAAIADISGLRDKWATKRAQAEAARPTGAPDP